MKIGFLKIWQPMMKEGTGYVVVAWHRKAWWSWGLWWQPRYPSQTPKWYVTRFRHRSMFIGLGRFGMLHFQHQM